MTVKEKAREIKEQIEQGGERAVGRIQEISEEVKGIAVRAEERLERGTEEAAAAGGARLERFAKGVRSTSKRVRKGEVLLADRLEQLADRMESAAHYLEESKARQLAKDAARQVQEHPAMLAGGAFLVGLVAGMIWSRATRPVSVIAEAERSESAKS